LGKAKTRSSDLIQKDSITHQKSERGKKQKTNPGFLRKEGNLPKKKKDIKVKKKGVKQDQ